MKLASIETATGATIAVRGDDASMIDLRHFGLDLPLDMRDLLELGPAALESIAGRTKTVRDRLDPMSVRYAPLVRQPHAVWCVALNYPTHVEEGSWERPSEPPLFLRVAASLCGHEEPIILPKVSDRLDYEGELAVVIGTTARHVAEADAEAVIAGYSCFNDGSVRDWQRHTTQITAGKNFASTGAFGPWLTTRDELPDLDGALLTTRVNGVERQHAKLGEMIFGIPKLINYLSTICELRPGDVVATGTPGGVGARQNPQRFMGQGDVVEIEIEGVGLLRNRIVSEVA